MVDKVQALILNFFLLDLKLPLNKDDTKGEDHRIVIRIEGAITCGFK